MEYRELEGPVEEALDDCDAVLLIGDEGLTALHFPLPGTTCHDLGALWQEWTGLPMVYAVWATREDFARAHGPELRAVEDGAGGVHGLRPRTSARGGGVGGRAASPSTARA